MTVEELINTLRNFPPETPIRFCADGGHIEFEQAGFTLYKDHSNPENNTLFIDIDGEGVTP